MPHKKFTRRKSFAVYKKVIELRKREFSYTEIRKETRVAKSTIHDWLTRAGLTLSKEHLEIQNRNKVRNHVIATEASRVTRQRRKDLEIQNFISKYKVLFDNSFFNFGIALYESEGSKGTDCKFSNSDYRLIQTFVKFIEKHFHLYRRGNMTFSLYLHETRKNDLEKILNFWSSKISIEKSKIYIYWKRNKVTRRKENPDYVGQISVRVTGEKIFGSKLQAISDIILRKYQRI